MSTKISVVSLNDRLQLPTKRQFTDAGQMIVPCSFARTGFQEYSAKALGIKDVEGDTMIKVFRDALEVFSEPSMRSFRSSPVTLGHPKDDSGMVKVTASNAREYQKGFLEGMPTRDEDTLIGTLVISDKEAIEAIESGDKELSAGYICDIIQEEVDGVTQYSQANIRANHIAIVSKGRAGSICSIADEEEAKPEETKVEEAVIEKTEETTEEKAEEVAESKPEEKGEDEVKEVTDEASKTVLNDEEFNKRVSVLVADKLEAILKAREVLDEDLINLSVGEIKAKVVQKLSPKLNLEDKTEEYINARFDILFEDGTPESPMGKLLRDTVVVDEIVRKKVDDVSEARTRMIQRNSKKEG